MKKSLMAVGLAAMMCCTSGCFTMCNDIAGAGDGASHSPMPESAAIMLDVITSPIQVAVVVVGGTCYMLFLGGGYVVVKTSQMFD